MLRRLFTLAIAVVLAVTFAASAVSVDVVKAQDTQEKPNIVWIMTDDQDFRSWKRMPAVRDMLASRGTVFENSFVTTSACCPSRATFLRGQYVHNHGVKDNIAPDGGWEKFNGRKLDEDHVGHWLQDAGYTTAWGGKYINQYAGDEKPLGWSRWWMYSRGIASAEKYQVDENGRKRWVQRESLSDPDYLAGKAEAFIGNRKEKPFFLVLSPFTPHYPYFYPKRHENKFKHMGAPKPPNFNEEDVSDKPLWVRTRPKEPVSDMDESYRKRMRGLLAVDDMVERTVRAVARKGELGNTIFVFTSDNGYLVGEHRWEGKAAPYEESIRVPLIAKGPGIPYGAKRTQMAANLDWGPTVADWAGATPPNYIDGRSLVPVIQDGSTPWRNRLLYEYFGTAQEERNWGARYENRGVRTADEKLYAEYPATGEKEYYDLKEDPYQLENAYPAMDQALQTELSTKLAELKDCAGETCRNLEDAP